MPEPASALPFGLGAANLGNLYRPLTDQECAAVLEAAWEAGVRAYDTAPHYGLGLSERRLGRFLTAKRREDYTLSTKVGRLLRPDPDGQGHLDTDNDFWVDAGTTRVWDFSASGLRRSLEESLTRLGVDRVDTVYLHDPEKHDLDEADRVAYPALAALRDEGLVDRVGVGSMSVDALARAARHAELDVMMIAGRLTLAEQPVIPGVLDDARHNGIRVVAAGVFNSGLLSHAVPPRDARYEYGATPPDLLAHVREIAAVCTRHGVDLPTAALHYPLTLDVVESVVVGGSQPAHVRENVARLRADVPAALWADLRERELAA